MFYYSLINISSSSSVLNIYLQSSIEDIVSLKVGKKFDKGFEEYFSSSLGEVGMSLMSFKLSMSLRTYGSSSVIFDC